MTATHRPRTGRMITGPRRMIHAVRYVNDELMRASEALSARPGHRSPAPGPRRPQPRTGNPSHNGLTGPHDRPIGFATNARGIQRSLMVTDWGPWVSAQPDTRGLGVGDARARLCRRLLRPFSSRR